MSPARNRSDTRRSDIRRGEVWWADEPVSGRRPVLVLSRQSSIDVLPTVLVAPISRTVRRIPSEVRLGEDEGLSVDCVACLDHVRPIRKTLLTERIGLASAARLVEAHEALRFVIDG